MLQDPDNFEVGSAALLFLTSEWVLNMVNAGQHARILPAVSGC